MTDTSPEFGFLWGESQAQNIPPAEGERTNQAPAAPAEGERTNQVSVPAEGEAGKNPSKNPLKNSSQAAFPPPPACPLGGKEKAEIESLLPKSPVSEAEKLPEKGSFPPASSLPGAEGAPSENLRGELLFSGAQASWPAQSASVFCLPRFQPQPGQRIEPLPGESFPPSPYGMQPPPFRKQPSSCFAQMSADPKKKRPSPFLSRRAGAVLMALCLLLSCAAGYLSGSLSYRIHSSLAAENSAAASSAGSEVKKEGAAFPALPAGTEIGNASLSVSEIAALASDSVVEVTTEVVKTGSFMRQYIAEGAGSGVILSEDGRIVTNRHVIEGARKITVRLRNGESYPAELLGSDSETDVAVLKIEAAGLSPVTFGASSELVVGEAAVAVGNPLGTLGGTVTDGIISATDRDISIGGQTMTLLQTNAAINPGNSGGGLFNSRAEFIGLVVAKSSGENVEGLGFAIPSDTVREVVKALLEGKTSSAPPESEPPAGMELTEIRSVNEAILYGVYEFGVYVRSVEPSSPAQRAGVRAGDRLLAVNGTQIAGKEQAESLLSAAAGAGSSVKITLSRNGRTGTLSLPLEEG